MVIQRLGEEALSKKREGDIVTGIIQQTDARYTLLDLGRVEAGVGGRVQHALQLGPQVVDRHGLARVAGGVAGGVEDVV